MIEVGPAIGQAENSAQVEVATMEAQVERMRLALDAADLHFWEWDIGTDKVTWSDGLYSAMKIAPQPLTGDTFKSLLHADDQDRVCEHLRAAVLGTDYDVTFRMIRGDGTVRWTRTKGKLILGADGRPARMVGYDRDITDIVEREAKSEERLRLATRAAGMGLYEFSVTEARCTWSKGVAAILGVPEPTEPTMETLAAAIHPEDKDDVLAFVRLASHQPGPHRFEFRVNRPDGSTRWVVNESESLASDDPSHRSVARVVGSLRDVTERRANQDRLRERIEELETLVDESPIGISGARDAACNEVWVNPALAKLLRMEVNANASGSHSNATPLPFVVQKEGRSLPPHEMVMQRSCASGQPILNEEVDVAFRDGTVINLLKSVQPLFDEAGHVRGCIAFNVDITEQKRLQALADTRAAEIEALYDAAPIGLGLFDEDFRFVRVNRVLAAINGRSPHEHVGRTIEEVLSAETTPILRALQPSLLAGEEVTGFEIEGPNSSGERRCWTVSYTPLRDDQGHVTRFLGTVLDVTENKRRVEQLRRSHATYLLLIEENPFGVYLVDDRFRLAQVSAGAQKVFRNVRPLLGRDFAEVIGTIWMEPFATEVIGHFRHTLATGEPYRADKTIEQRGDIDEVEGYDWKIERIALPDGSYGVVCYFYDLTERLQHEEQVRLLMHEINHRANNMLSLVGAVARHTTADAGVAGASFLNAFERRIQALAASQSLLIRGDWKSVAIVDLVTSQLVHFGDLLGTRIIPHGPPAQLTPPSAQGLGMAFHELATNAGKYGALSNGTGCVDISWTLVADSGDGPGFTITWAERDGPPVSPPMRRGFGTTVLDRMVRMMVGGKVSLDYADTGLVWHLACPAHRVLAMDTLPHDQRPVHASPFEPATAGTLQILVVEDDALVALSVASVLSEAGFHVAGPVSSVAEAMALLDHVHCDAAIVDVNLVNETAEPIANRLQREGVPFITVTAGLPHQQPAIFQSAPRIEKPVQSDRLIEALARIIRVPGPATEFQENSAS